jgi:hypothetical protein
MNVLNCVCGKKIMYPAVLLKILSRLIPVFFTIFYKGPNFASIYNYGESQCIIYSYS